MLSCKLYVDFDRDGSFATAGDDLSAYWQSTAIRAGVSGKDAHCAAVGTCTIRLDNSTRIFSMDLTTGTYYGKLVPYLPAKVVAVQDGIDVATIFRGVVKGWYPDSGHKHGKRGCTLELIDFMGVLQGAGIDMPLQEEETAATLLNKVCAIAFDGDTASASLTVIDAVANNDTLTVGDRVYTFKTTLTGASDEILIGTPVGGTNQVDTTAENIAAAINADSGSGTSYGVGTARHQDVTATAISGEGVGSAYVVGWAALRDAATNAEALGGLHTAFWGTEADSLTLSSIKLYLKKTGSPTGTLTLRIETEGGVGIPSGTLFNSNATGTVGESTLSAGGGWITINLAGPVTFYPYTRYWLILTTDRASSGVNYIEWARNDPAVVASCIFGLYKKVGGVWSTVTAGGFPTYAILWINSTVALSANTPGAWGNALALSTTSTGITASGALFTGGTDAPSGLTSFDTGQTFPIAADSWTEEKTNGLSAVQDIADSEQGLMLAARDGTLTFKDYQWIFEQLPETAALDLSNTPDAIKPRVVLEDIVNDVSVDFIPRRQSAAGVVIATANGDIEVPVRAGGPGSSPGTVTVKLNMVESATGNLIGATNVIAPVASTDYTVWARVDQNGTTIDRARNVTSKNKIRVTLTVKGGAIEATFYNKAWVPLFVSGFQVRGTALIAYDRQTVTASDSTSIGLYGRRGGGRIKLPFPSDKRFAESVATYTLARNKNPRTVIDSVSFKGTTAISGVNLYSLDLLDVITLTDTQTAISNARYLIIGWTCNIKIGGAHTLAWNVRRLDDPQTWLLGSASYSQIGTTTVLAL